MSQLPWLRAHVSCQCRSLRVRCHTTPARRGCRPPWRPDYWPQPGPRWRRTSGLMVDITSGSALPSWGLLSSSGGQSAHITAADHKATGAASRVIIYATVRDSGQQTATKSRKSRRTSPPGQPEPIDFTSQSTRDSHPPRVAANNCPAPLLSTLPLPTIALILNHENRSVIRWQKALWRPVRGANSERGSGPLAGRRLTALGGASWRWLPVAAGTVVAGETRWEQNGPGQPGMYGALRMARGLLQMAGLLLTMGTSTGNQAGGTMIIKVFPGIWIPIIKIRRQ